MNILRPRVAGEEKFLVRETYPLDLCKQTAPSINQEKIENLLLTAKENDTIKKGNVSQLVIPMLLLLLKSDIFSADATFRVRLQSSGTSVAFIRNPSKHKN